MLLQTKSVLLGPSVLIPRQEILQMRQAFKH